jgi:hypothetical protein
MTWQHGVMLSDHRATVSVVAITNLHIRFLWGAFDLAAQQAATPSYVGATSYATLGANAAGGGGIGVRRATLVLDRSTASPADDAATMHFDFLNITGGNPDDTWIASDYTTLEGYLTTWFTAVAGVVPAYCRLTRIYWHRVGPGIPKPNAAERILDIASPIPGTGSRILAPQTASTITFRTGLRRHWGRTYVPLGGSLDANARVGSTAQTTLASNTVTLFHSAASADFHPVVLTTNPDGAVGIEAVEVDDVPDTQRRRRWKKSATKTLTAL